MIDHSRFNDMARALRRAGNPLPAIRFLAASLVIVALSGCARWPAKPTGAVPNSCLEPTALQWYQSGNAAAESGRLERAADAYRHALALDPDMARARHNLGLVYLRLGTRNIVQARRVLPRDDQQSEDTAAYLRCLVDGLTTGNTSSCAP